MEVTTIIGIVVAVIIILVGLRMVLRKPNDAAPSLESELHINEDCKQPVIPRHVRDQLRTDRESQEQVRVEPNLTALDSVEVADEKQQKIEDVAVESNAIHSTELEHAAITQQTEKTETVASTESATESVKALDVQTEPTTQTHDSAKAVVSQDKEEAFQFNANVETAEIKEFDEESSILDVHLNEQQKYDDESVLSTAETIIALNVYPNPRKALSGDKTLKMLLKYGLRFGELSCFHRYENPEEESHLLFSVLRVTDNGPDGFDLETLSTEQVQGLAFFLALPHSDVQKGFDTMVSIAGLIAREIDGTVYDENNLEFTPQLKEHWRHKAIDYRSGHDA
ncbi:cell division protein ZipA [Acinetobacter sp. RIT698]|jgi:cell division protein ZipA|uniref:cell division protein ZipA C-terminal FtsZ-binding domain-containing protein n=1 Tax=Acinetobacter TaxID=469 RepID=UPI00125F1A8C|nr:MULTISPECIES: cell division protein ZipA C-terminal FtsZ-binding domain-containing protein [Acinetobacter]MDN5416174.1 cell division protein ZipA [Acinetobacter sp.]MCS4299881.1 cell division protein ZipA [Acinetobacter guillouiae]MCU4494444.1 cell division protein ZipA [Acinetobacter guillouiae]MCW2253281.1 cell division protein ZipA [Acinetobacter sp. BIGb0204]MDN5622311.1 cell division protein ZipA [Acinetobacter sp.]